MPIEKVCPILPIPNTPSDKEQQTNDNQQTKHENDSKKPVVIIPIPGLGEKFDIKV